MTPQVNNEITSRFFKSTDYDILCSWWKAQNWPMIPFESLPELGIIIMLNGTRVCSGFIYQTDSNIALMEWIVADPELAHPFRGECLNALITDLTGMAKNLGFKKLITMLTNQRLISRVEDHGFQMTDKNMTHLVKEL